MNYFVLQQNPLPKRYQNVWALFFFLVSQNLLLPEDDLNSDLFVLN